MCATATEIHPFEQAGLGLAPFSYAGMSEKVYVACVGAPEQPAGTCDFCGTGIRYCCHIRSADRKEFIVGCDCVRKLERVDNRMVSAMEREIAKRERAKREEIRAANWKAACERRDAKEAEERKANGGLTNAELRRKEEDERRQEESRKYIAANAWLLNVLDAVPYPSEFIGSMEQQLGCRYAKDLSEKCLNILADIYAKATTDGARRNSKKFDDAISQFNTLVKG